MQVVSIARSQSPPAAMSRRAQMILWLADGETTSAVARALLRIRHRWTVQRVEARYAKSQMGHHIRSDATVRRNMYLPGFPLAL